MCVQGREFYSSYNIKNGKTDVTIYVGDCFTLTMKKNPKDSGNEASINIRRTAKFLKKIINEAEFILSMADAAEVTIGKVNLPIKIPSDGDRLIDQLRKNINDWKELDATLCKIGANEDIDMSILSQDEEKMIDILIIMIGKCNELNLNKIEPGLINVKIANLNLLLLAYRAESGKYILKTFFDKSLGIKASYKYPDGVYEESIYGVFDRQMILDCYNFPYADIIPSYEAVRDINPHTCERMNLLMLEMLSAYDMMTIDKSPRKEILLKTVIDMSDWLLAHDDKNNETLHLVNKYQILKRQEKLTNIEVKILKRLQLENTANPFFVCGIALLLDDLDSFDFYWEKLSFEEQAHFKSFPIWIFKK